MAWDASKPANDEKLVDTPAQIRANWDAIALGTDSALQITNAKVSASAAIVDTKLATISTAGKVSGAALTSLGSVPSGGGQLPIANGGTNASTAQGAINALCGTSAQGDILYFNGTNWVHLAAGTANNALLTGGAGANPAWGNPTGLNISGQAQGDILYFNGTNWVRLAAGTSGYFLQTQGAGANPAWISNAQPAFGARVDKSSSYGAQQATTDGFVTVWCACAYGNNVCAVVGKTDSSSTPTTSIVSIGVNGNTMAVTGVMDAASSFMMPVKKNDYWSVTKSVIAGATSVFTVYWMPVA